MKIVKFKSFESLDVPKIEIPKDTAMWCVKHYCDSLRFGLTGTPTITKEMIDATEELLKDYSDGYLYRGITLDYEELQEAKKKGFVEMKYQPSSWTWDKETARSFAFPYGDYGLLMRCSAKKFKKYFSMDVVMENIDVKEVKEELPKDEYDQVKHYISESEIIAFDDHLKITFKDIHIIKPQQ